jgi:hypothetical protein
MSYRGVLFALTDDQARRFLAAASDEELRELVQEIEEAWDEEHLVETDKAWDAIHRCLSDGSIEFAGGAYPLNRCILGGKQLYQGDEYIISFVPADEVPDVARALGGVTESWFRERFSLLRDTDFPHKYLEGEFEMAWDYLGFVRAFYEKAAEDKRSVIFTVDL